MKKRTKDGASALRSRHRAFFKSLDAFLERYARGVCGETSPSSPQIPPDSLEGESRKIG